MNKVKLGEDHCWATLTERNEKHKTMKKAKENANRKVAKRRVMWIPLGCLFSDTEAK